MKKFSVMQKHKDAKKILLISEVLSAPFDEGIRNLAYSVHKQLHLKGPCISVTKANSHTKNLEISQVNINKLFLNYELWRLIRHFSPDFILYLPEASVLLF